MNTVLQDLRYALRQLMHAPAFTATVVVTLALGIGANTAIFTIFDQVLLRMLPVENPKELVRFSWTGSFQGSMSSFGGDSRNYFSYPMYKDLRDRNTVFSGLAAADRASVGVAWHDQSENQDAEVVSGNYFEVLGLRPVVGRLLSSNDDTAKNANPVVALSFNYWRTRFNASQDVVGKTLLLNGHPFTILGVVPAGFHSAISGYTPGVFIPTSMVDIAMPWMASRDDLNRHDSVWLTLIARLKTGVSQQQAEASLAPLWHALRAQELTGYGKVSPRFKDGFLNHSNLSVIDDSTGFMPERADLGTPLKVLMSMVGVLAAMCAVNIATLLLLRAAGRVREISMRYALGAARSRIISQLLVEGMVLGAGGAILGVLISPLIARTLVGMMTQSDDPTEAPYSTSVDTRVLLFALGVSLVVTLAFSVAPALQFLRPRLAEALRQNSGTASKSSQRFRKIAVGLQISLTVLLLGGAGLFLRTFSNLRSENLGFQTSHLLNFDLDPTLAGYGDDRAAQVETSALVALRQVPGVISAGGSSDPELSGDSSNTDYTVEGHVSAEDDDSMNFESPWITSSLFATLRQPILAGREFTDADTKLNPKVAIVNLTFAKRFFGTPQNALGHFMTAGQGDVKLDTTIVGVVGDVRHRSLREAIRCTVYRPYLQQNHPGGLKLYALTGQEPKAVEAVLRDRIRRLDPKLVVDGMRTMEEQVDRSVANERALAMLAASFALLALLMTSIGLYGVLAFATAQRTREIGVRMALGAKRSSVVMLVMREMALTAIIGVAIALPAAFGLSRLLQNLLFGVSPGDPITVGACVLVTALMVTLSAAIPARRAASIDPMKALRSE